MSVLSPELEALLKQSKAKFTRNSRAYKLKEGKTQIRVLVPNPGQKFWRELGVHSIKTELNGKPVAVVGCRDTVYDEPCEICTAIDKAHKMASDDETAKIIKEWKAKTTVLVNALIRDGADASDKPQIVDLPQTAWTGMMSVIEEWGMDVDFIVERKGKGFDTEYTVQPAPAAKTKALPKGVLEQCQDLDKFIETEFFRGDHVKALKAITNLTGVVVSGAAAIGSGRANTALLTSASASVAEEIASETADLEAAMAEVVVEEPAPWEEAAAPAAAPSPAPAAPKAAAPAAKPAKSFGAPMPEDDVEALMRELEGISA